MSNNTINFKRTLGILCLFFLLNFSLNAQISSFPYEEDFESGWGNWDIVSTNASSWDWGAPNGIIINSAASGSYALATNLDGNYRPNEDGYLRSPEFDFSTLINPVVEFSLWWKSENQWDGAVLQYSVDNQVSWQNVGSIGSGVNWYNTIFNLDSGNPGGQNIGWSGSQEYGGGGSEGWVTVSHPIDNLAGENSVYFRLAFGSDETIQDEGVAFDDFKIIDFISIPDPQFEQALIDLNIDSDNTINGQVLRSDISVITELLIDNHAIYNFEGLQSFSNLEVFRYTSGYVPDLLVDFSNNFNLRIIEIDRYGGSIISSSGFNQLDLTNNIALEELIINTGSLVTLDLSQNVNLRSLYLHQLYGLQMIDLSNLSQLRSLYLAQLYGIESLDLSNLSQLEELELIEFNQIADLNLANLSLLKEINLSFFSNLTNLDFSNLIQIEGVSLTNLEGITSLDFSNQTQLRSVNVNAFNLRAVNLKNGSNVQLAKLDVKSGFNGACVLIDNLEYAQNNVEWQINNSIYSEVLCVSPALTESSDAFDNFVNQEIEVWLNNHGYAEVYFYNETITWDYSLNILINEFDNIIYETTFVASSAIGEESTLGQFVLNTRNFTAGQDFFPINGDEAGGIEAEGSLCSDESGIFDLNLFNRDINGDQIDFDNDAYQNAVIVYQQDVADGTGGAVTSIEGTKVRFPDTGAGQFSYHYTLSVSTELQYFGMPEPVILNDEADVWHWLTVPFDPGPAKQLTVCSTENVTLQDLYNTLDIEDGTTSPDFNPNDYWFNSNNNRITEVNGPGEYIFNAESFLPQCGGKPVTVTLINETPVVQEASDLTVQYNPLGNDTEVDNWIANNGGANVSGCGSVTWEWEIFDFQLFTQVNPDDTFLVCTIQFNAFDSNAIQVANSTALLKYEGFPSAGLSLGFGENLCGNEFYDLNEISSIDPTSNAFDASIIEITQLEGPEQANTDNPIVIFPDTGAGQFTYRFDYKVSTTLNIAGEALLVEDSSELTVLDLTIPFNPGPDKVVCFNGINTLEDLYAQLDIEDGTTDPTFNLVDYWFDSNGNSMQFYQGPGVYVFNAEAFLPSCGGIPTTITVFENPTLNEAAQDLVVNYDGSGNQSEVNVWLNSNGGAMATSACSAITWQYSLINESLSDSDFDFIDDQLNVQIEFTATDEDGNSVFTNASIIYNNFATAGESIGNGGALCSVTSYDLNDLDPTINYTSSKFNSTSFEITQVDGKPGANSSGTRVDFPDTGAGQFSYIFEFNARTSFSVGTEPVFAESSTFYSTNNVTVPFDPGPNKTIFVCGFDNLTLSFLYDQLDIEIGIDENDDEFNQADFFQFNPDNYWFNENDNLEVNPNLPPLTAITEPGTYQFNAKSFLEDCAGEPVFLTIVQACDINLNLKAFLQGPYDVSTGLMKDDLRSQNLLNTLTPYADGISCSPDVFNVTGENAIVDWIWIELRDSNDDTNILVSRSALLQRDGDIVDLDGVSPLLVNTSDESYYVVINHRNHLGTMSVDPLSISASGSPINIDFTDGSTLTYGNNAQFVFSNSSLALWAGDANGDGKINFIGSSNDTNSIRDIILNDPVNQIIQFYGFSVNAYTNSDINLNGSSNIIGVSNDATLLRDNILNHPINIFLQFYGYNILEQLPMSVSQSRMAFDIEMSLLNRKILNND